MCVLSFGNKFFDRKSLISSPQGFVLDLALIALRKQ